MSPQAAVTADGGLVVSGLSLSKFPQHGLLALMLPGSQQRLTPALVEQQLAEAQSLDYQRTFDRSTDSWSLSLALPPLAKQPELLHLWCDSCRVEGSELSLDGLVGSSAVDGGESGTLVLVLREAVMPGDVTTAAASRARRLQQAADCTMTMGSQAYSFASCTQPPATDGFNLTIFATIEANGAGTILHMGLEGQTGGGWAG
jgi:hypothetical protein